MSNSKDKESLGLAILGITSVMGSWSAWNSSLFTIDTFMDNPIKIKSAKLAMMFGLGTAMATGLGIYAVYGKEGRIAAIGSGLAGVLLYTVYSWKMSKLPGEIKGPERFGGLKKASRKLPEGLEVAIAGYQKS